MARHPWTARLFAFQTIRWNREGILEIGFPSATHGIRGNLCLSGEGPHPVVQGDFEGDRIQMMLDTGAWKTRLLPSFAKDFSQVVQERGKKGFTRLNGAKEFETITLPEVRFRLGGFDGVLRPAEILSNFFPFGTSEYHVKLGLGLLQQARQVTIDFHSMNFSME